MSLLLFLRRQHDARRPSEVAGVKVCQCAAQVPARPGPARAGGPQCACTAQRGSGAGPGTQCARTGACSHRDPRVDGTSGGGLYRPESGRRALGLLGTWKPRRVHSESDCKDSSLWAGWLPRGLSFWGPQSRSHVKHLKATLTKSPCFPLSPQQNYSKHTVCRRCILTVLGVALKV